MSAAAKLVIGVIIFLVGIYWYAAPLFGQNFLTGVFGSTFHDFVIVFGGLFGLFLILLGLLIAWIEAEDIKWEKKEKQEQAKQPAKKKAKKSK
ncbi:MAG TPA: hypothetical protein VJA47_00505 [archaeon]|nr:hypothetical protein [archaeon]